MSAWSFFVVIWEDYDGASVQRLFNFAVREAGGLSVEC